MGDIVKRIVVSINNFLFGWSKEMLKVGSPSERNDILAGVKTWVADGIGKVDARISAMVAARKHMSPSDSQTQSLLLAGEAKDHVFQDIAVGIAGETMSLGQIEAFGSAMQYMSDTLGIKDFVKPLLHTPFDVGIMTPTRYYYNSIFTPLIPGSTDLIRFAVREAWLPALQANCPQFVIDNMKFQGFEEMWTKYYWAAHWIIPTYEQARTAFWYGIINRDEFLTLRKYADLSPSYDKIWDGLQYNYPDKIDIRWLREWGIINHAEMVDLIKTSGFHPDYVEKMVYSYERNLLRAEAERVRTAWVNLYSNGYATKEKLTSELTKLGLYPESIPLLIQEADLKLDLDNKNDYLKIYVTQLKAAKITSEVFIANCRTLGMTEEAITRNLGLIQSQAKT